MRRPIGPGVLNMAGTWAPFTPAHSAAGSSAWRPSVASAAIATSIRTVRRRHRPRDLQSRIATRRGNNNRGGREKPGHDSGKQGSDPRGGTHVGKNDLRRTGADNGADDPAPRGKCGALLAVVLAVFQPG